MANATDYAELEWLNIIFGRSVLGSATVSAAGIDNYYVGLAITMTGDTGAGFAEVTDATAYARQILPNVKATGGDPGFTTSVNVGGTCSVSNNASIDFDRALAGNPWGLVHSVGIFDQLAGGNLMAYADLTEDRNVEAGVQLTINAEELVIQLS